MIVKDVIKYLNELAPPFLIEKWDNSGLQVGSFNKEVKKVLLSLDVSQKAINYGINNKVDMIITHHPFFFDNVKRISYDDNRGKILYNLIKKDITVYSLHTNLDACSNGVSEILGNLLKIKDMKVLAPTHTEKLYKLVVFVPQTHSEEVRKAITEKGGGHIGNYSHCTFSTKGIGTFKPLKGTNPFIGEEGKIEEVEEIRIETVLLSTKLPDAIEGMKEAHPYEEVAYDVYPLINKYVEYGHGRIGFLEKATTIKDYAEEIKISLNCDDIRVYGNLNKRVKKVALCGGRGADFISDAFKKGADVYVTGDIKYHDAQLASELGISLIDAGHYHTEKHILDYLKKYIIERSRDEISVEIFNENNYSYKSI